MRYWAYFAGKVVVAAGPLYGLLLLIAKIFAQPNRPDQSELEEARDTLANMGPALVHDLALLVWFLLCAGVLYAIIRDQRHRCRTCLRRLRMPIETGSRGFTLQMGPPAMESICPYGHGTLREDDEQSGLTATEWTPHSDNVWDELCAPSKESGQDQ